MKRLLSPRFLIMVISVLTGAFLGLGIFTFNYGQGTSYLGSESAACANCHVMQGHFDAWSKSSHGKFANCNDCHAPHDLIGKYYCKSRNGLFHSLAFSTGDFPDQILMHKYNRDVVEQNCRDCHQDFVHSIDLPVFAKRTDDIVSCLHCHSGVGHNLR